MYQINDTTVYGLQGVYTIRDIISQQNRQYYVLQSVHEDGATIFVPTDSGLAERKMRPALTESEVISLIEMMPDPGAEWTSCWPERKQRYQKILEEGNRTQMVRQIKILQIKRAELARKHRKLHLFDEQFFEQATAILSNEFSYALKIPPEQVVPFIQEHLEKISIQ